MANNNRSCSRSDNNSGRKMTMRAKINKLDKVFGKYIRARDGRCVTCGATTNLQCGHLFSRQAYSTRWDERNAYCQCASCNLRHEHDPYPLISYYLSLYSQEDLDNLHAKYRTPRKYTDRDLDDLIERYANLLNNLTE